jgi:hypothetical protein
VTYALIKVQVPKPITSKLRAARDYIGHKYFMYRLFGRYAPLIPPLALRGLGCNQSEYDICPRGLNLPCPLQSDARLRHVSGVLLQRV